MSLTVYIVIKYEPSVLRCNKENIVEIDLPRVHALFDTKEAAMRCASRCELPTSVIEKKLKAKPFIRLLLCKDE